MYPGNSPPDPLIEALRSNPSREAWAEFLRSYSPVIFQTCELSASNRDEAADCFLFACEQLSRNNFRRLLQFRPQGPASFPTWLRVVVRNLCLDWRRKQYGRPRLFRSIARLPQLEVEVYRCRHEQGLSIDETFFSLRPSFPGLTMQRLRDTEEHVQESLTSRQSWLIGARKSRVSLTACHRGGRIEEDETIDFDPADPRPGQESELAMREELENLRAAVARLAVADRLLLRLRFDEELSLAQIARLTGLGDPQRVHRRIQDIVRALKKKMAVTAEIQQ